VPSYRKQRIALTLILLLLSCLGFAQQQVIESIEIHGNRRIPADTIRSRIFTREGDVYDPAALERDFNSLWNTGYYEDLRFEREESPKGYRLHIYVKEKPTIRRIDYKGLSSVSQSDVLEAFKKAKVGLSVESQYDPTKVKKAENVLRELLAAHGRQFASIRPEVQPVPPASVAITFNIKEGTKVKVGDIKFEGNKKLSSRYLRSAMKNSKPIGIPHSIILENLFSRTYDSTKLEEDAERVREAMREKGYFKALVGDPKTNMRDHGRSWINPFSGPGKAVDITMPVEEGDRYKLKEITFSGSKININTKFLRRMFPMKDGDIFSTAQVRKGLEQLRKAYGQLGYINFSPVPDTEIDEDNKQITLKIDLDEGKQYFVRRIEFQGNTTTRDKVIRRELAIEEGGLYNTQAWENSLLRLNQLQYFEQLKPEDATDVKRNDQEGYVDLTLKLREKGKNSIGLTGGVSGLAGSFIGLNYQTNNFLGLGETLTVEANVGSRERNLLFGFTEPYLFDRPLQFGFTVYNRRFDYNQAKENEILLNQQLNLSQDVLNTFQNYSQSSTGFTTSLSYPLRRSFKRVGITYAFDTSTVRTFSTASQQLFEQLAFRNLSGPNSLKGIITSKLIPNFSYSSIDYPQRPHTGKSLYMAADVSGIGGNVASIRPVVEFKQFFPMKNFRFDREGGHTLGYRLLGSYITGYRGLVANPAERFYTGGDQDLRGFDIRTVSPYAFLVDQTAVPLVNPDDPCAVSVLLPCTGVPIDPANPLRGNVNIPVPVSRIIVPGGDTQFVGNLEYRVPIVGPVTLAAFSDFGMNFVARNSQLKITPEQLNLLNSTVYGCQDFNATAGCIPPTVGSTVNFSRELKLVPGTNFTPRLSTGLELQVILPIVNAPFRIYYAYNPLALDTTVPSTALITRDLFPSVGPSAQAGTFTYQRSLALFEPAYRLREPRRTFRFTVATTF
jgi:outer membrane protein insertion porin family